MTRPLDLRLDVRVRAGDTIFSELRGLRLHYKNGALWPDETIKVIRGADNSDDGRHRDYDDVGILKIRAPQAGGLLEIVYRRGGREYKHAIIVN